MHKRTSVLLRLLYTRLSFFINWCLTPYMLLSGTSLREISLILVLILELFYFFDTESSAIQIPHSLRPSRHVAYSGCSTQQRRCFLWDIFEVAEPIDTKARSWKYKVKVQARNWKGMSYIRYFGRWIFLHTFSIRNLTFGQVLAVSWSSSDFLAFS